MDSKTIKLNLKQAKEAIKNKDVESALQLCKDVLKQDRNNYLALVLLGAAFQESSQKDQAPNAYRKAIEVSPDQMLAWQGLANFYEKNDNDKNADQLVPVYQRLLHLESDTAKWCDIIFKMQSIIMKFQSDVHVVEVLEAHKKTEDNSKQDALRKLVIHYLSHSDKVPEQYLKLFDDFLNSAPELEDAQYQVYLKVLYDLHKKKELLELGDKLYAKNGQNLNSCIAEWMCKVCAEQYVDSRAGVVGWVDRLPVYYTGLLETDGDNVMAVLAQAVYHMTRSCYLEARDCLHHCLNLNKGLFHAICLLAESNLHLLCLDPAETLAQTASTLRPAHVFPKAVLAKTMSLMDSRDKWEQAVSLASEVLKEGPNELAAEALCQSHMQLQQGDQLEAALIEHGVRPALAQLMRLRIQLTGDQLFSTLSQQTPDCPEAWYQLGLLYLGAEQLDNACTAFLKCAKMAPHWYTAYLELGHLYSKSAQTLDKARRCYQRALVLNPAYVPTMISLSDTYRALGDGESNLELLKSVSQKGGGQWVWPRLGLQYSDLGDFTAAINCLRSALKSDPNNSHMWEALADAYLARGANGSALKSYQKALELNPGEFYPALQIATIKKMTDLPEEALQEFRDLVEKQPSSTMALKGLCETCLCLANNFISRRLLGLARDRLQEGLNATSRALQLRPDIACLWKLAGECMTIVGCFPSSWHFLNIPQVLYSKSESDQTLQGIQLLELGARCMCRCLKLMPEQVDAGRALVWHDLAYNYRQQAKLSPSAGVWRKALAAAQESVRLNPALWTQWNQLGIVAAMPGIKKYALAQHAFIKATMLDDTVAVPWSNLGVLYLSLGELKLANKAFAAAQRTDTEFCPSWVGQALIAEQVNNLETMELFRHTTQLGYHAESCLGYGEWVCRTLQLSDVKNDPHNVYIIEKMHAVPAAIDALTWATDEEEENVCGLNMLGSLLERCGLYQTSLQVLSRAVDHSPPAHRDKVLNNFGRLLLKAGKVEDAIQVYQAISKADIHSQCGLALSLYKGKRYQEAYEAYEAAMEWWASDDAMKAHLYVAMAAVAYKMAGADQAKTLLLKSMQMGAPSVHGLFGACSLGMLNSDLDLSQLALRDMLKHQNQTEYISDIALFQAFIKFIQGDIGGSVWSMSKTVHRQPSLASLWLHLALLILQSHTHSPDLTCKVTVAARCAQTAMALGRSLMDVSKVLAVVSLSQLLGGEMQRALSSSQHAVHLYPWVGESWAVLAASCHVARPAAPLRSLISHARQNTDLERNLAKWMSNFERKMALVS